MSALTNNPRGNIKPDDIVIAVVGITGVGKSTFINLFSDFPVTIGHELEACTAQVAIFPATLPDGTKLWLVDTPGFDDTYRSDTDILREVAGWLAEAYTHKIKLSGIIYLHRIQDARVGGSGMKNLRMFKALCGEDGLGSVVLATTCWSNVTAEEGKKREQQLCENSNMWKKMIDKGSKVFRQDRAAESAYEIIKYLVDKKRPVTLDIQKDLVDKGLSLDGTAAGQEVMADLERQRIEYERRLKELRTEMSEALAQKDRERQEELKEWRSELDQKMLEAQENERNLRANGEELRHQLEEASRRGEEMREHLTMEKERLEQQLREEARIQNDQFLQRLRDQEVSAADQETRMKDLIERQRLENELRMSELRVESEKAQKSAWEAASRPPVIIREKSGICVVM